MHTGNCRSGRDSFICANVFGLQINEKPLFCFENKVRENVANTCYLPPPPLQTHPKWFCKSGLTKVQCRRLTKGSALSRIFEGWPKGSANWKLCTFEGWPKGSGAGVMHITPCLYAFTSFQFRPHCVARNFVDCLPMTWKFPIWVRSMRQRHINSVSIRLKFTGNTFKSSESTKRFFLSPQLTIPTRYLQ